MFVANVFYKCGFSDNFPLAAIPFVSMATGKPSRKSFLMKALLSCDLEHLHEPKHAGNSSASGRYGKVLVPEVAMAQNYQPPKWMGFPTKHDHFCGSLVP